MRVLILPSRDEMGKFRGLVEAFPEIWDGTLLDVGCRSGKLQRALPKGHVRYIGLDLFPSANVVGNLEQGLPFGWKSFDIVVALDILEHTDDIHTAFGELCRVANKYVLISLPNAYEIKSRIKFLFGKKLSGKYGLTPEPPKDRHRWLFSLEEARTYVYAMKRLHGFEIAAEGYLVGPRRALVVGKFVINALPNLFSPWYVCLLRRNME